MSVTDSPGGQRMLHPTEGAPPAAIGADDELRKQAVARLKRKRKFTEDAFGYVTVNGVLWLIWALSGRGEGGGMPWPAWVSLVWGFFLVMDAWQAFGPWPRSLHQPISEADIEREIRRTRDA